MVLFLNEAMTVMMYLVSTAIAATVMRFNPSVTGIRLKDPVRDWRHQNYVLTLCFYYAALLLEIWVLGGTVGLFVQGRITEMAQSVVHVTPSHHFDYFVWSPMMVLYTQQLAFYSASMFNLGGCRTPGAPRAKDLARMVFHHMVTIALMLGAMATGYLRLGVLVMFLHDMADVALYGAMAFQYVAKEQGRYKGLTTFFWVLFLAGFTVGRVLVFLRTLVTWMRAPQLLNYCAGYPQYLGHYPAVGWAVQWVARTAGIWVDPYALYNPDCIDMRRALVYMLLVLYILQLTWFVDIVRMTFRMLTTPDGVTVKDVRAQDEVFVDDDDDQKKKDD